MFLIVTALGVRLLIIRHNGPNDSSVAPSGSVASKFADAPKAALPEVVMKNDAVSKEAPALSELTDQKLPVAIDESHYEVLPPSAAMKKDRKLPGILHVGDEAGMFEDLHPAIQAMVPGDVTEIRTNRILTVEPCLLGKELASEIEPVDLPPLMIRAAEGYFPLLRVAQPGPVIRVHHRSIWLKNLHFAARDIPIHWIQGEGLSVLAQNCSFTGGNFVNALGTSKGRLTTVLVDQCFFRNASIVPDGGGVGNVGIYRSAIIACRTSTFGPGDHTIDMQRSTFLTTSILAVSQVENEVPPRILYQMDKCIFQQFACCPNLIQLRVNDANFPANPENTPATFNRFVPGFSVTDSVLSFHAPDGLNEGWGLIEAGPKVLALRSSIFPMIERQMLSLGLSPRASAARDGCWNGLGGKDPAFPATFDLDRPDLIFTTDVPAVQQQLDARSVGCVPEWLPPIPVQAMDIYAVRPLP